MKKTLFIKIDNTPAPIEADNDYISLDCRQINDFCSFVGDALVGDFKDESGIPYYRLYSPVGKLLLEFKQNNPEHFDVLLQNWYNVLLDILRNGNSGSVTIKLLLSDVFVNWLLMHENDHYAIMGHTLKDNCNAVLLSRKELTESIIPTINRMVRENLSFLHGNFRAVILSGDINVEQSYIIVQIRQKGESCDGINGIPFYNLNDWKCLLDVELRERIDCLDDRRAFKVDVFVLGESVPDSFKHIEGNLNYKGGQIIISNGICKVIKAQKGTEAFDNLVGCIFTNNREIKSQSFAECHHQLSPLGFKVERTKLTMNFKEMNDNLPISALTQVSTEVGMMIVGSALSVISDFTELIVYKESLVKDTPDFICELMFFSDKGINNLGMRRRMSNTLDEISISIKHRER